MTRRPLPPAQFSGPWADADVMPEIRGLTIEAMTHRNSALRLWCRACGRDVLITPRGLRELGRRVQDWSVERFVQAARCDTCGARRAQGSGWSLEAVHMGRAIIVRQEHHGGPRLDRQ